MVSPLPPGVVLRVPVATELEEILPPAALALLAKLHRQFEGCRQELLAKRAARQKDFDDGKLPDFLPETKAIREASWTIAAQPADLLNRRVEITGPTAKWSSTRSTAALRPLWRILKTPLARPGKT
jgi:malate synthase